MNEYTLSLGGPVVRNKTFFFGLWNGLLPRNRENINATILTPCARRGIFRYYDNWSNGNVNTVTSLGTTPTTSVVDHLGNPVAPGSNPNGSAHSGVLRYASVFGPPTTTSASNTKLTAVIATKGTIRPTPGASGLSDSLALHFGDLRS